jgi:hypothetical protein
LTMSLDIFDRWGGPRLRKNGPKPRSDMTICSALLPPDSLQFTSSTGLEHVSGGCWSEDRQAVPISLKNCCEVVHPRASFRSCRDVEDLNYDQTCLISNTNLAMPSPKWGRDTLGSRCSCCSKPESHSFSPSQLDSHAWLYPTSPTSSSSIDSIETSADHLPGCRGSVFGKIDLYRDLGTQNALRTNIYGGEIRNSTDPQYGALRSMSAPAHESTDAISIAASSIVLSPAQMPKITCGDGIAGGDSDCRSLDTGSGYSVEVDEMIDLQSQQNEEDTWKDLLRQVWHKTRFKHR